MGKLVTDCLDQIKKRRQNLLDGKVNCIPTPFKRFCRDFVGLEIGMYYDVTSFTKGAKTQFTSYTFLYYPLLFAYFHPELGLDLTYLYFSLEEEKERIMQRFMSFLLYQHTNQELRFSPRELRSTQYTVDEEALAVLESDDVMHILEFFEEHVIFIEEYNPTGIMKSCEQYAQKRGKVIYEDYVATNEWGNPETKKRFKEYIPNNPEQYIIPIIDTINLVDAERGMTQKQAIDKMSEYCAKILRNRYKMSPVVIQQQAFEQEKIDEFKLKNDAIRPSLANLGDSKYPSRDANVVIGLFSPVRFHLHQYQGYDIDIMDDNIRFVEILSNRDGEMGGMTSLYFDGAVCSFAEMPRAQIKDKQGKWIINPELEKFYDKLVKRRAKQEKELELKENSINSEQKKIALLAFRKWKKKKKKKQFLKSVRRFITSCFR